MLFNSLDFAIFLPIVFILYWFVTQKNLRLQNGLIVVASYVFYGWWDWRFLSLLLFSSLVDFVAGIAMQKEVRPGRRKWYLLLSIVSNLGLLGFFKYCNFFLESFSVAFSWMGMPLHTGSLNIILPVGISFYTFQSLSYGIDVYRRKLEPTRDLISFLAFVSFFPQLVAGPIERATHLLPQFKQKRVFNYVKAVDGFRQILWGLFKKMVIADNCGQYADTIFNQAGHWDGSTLLLGAFFFAFQIYGDFSGYSDMAVGLSRLFGFDLMQNFSYPYFSENIADFWRRWHISLSTWFRDYLYIPLGGNRKGRGMTIRNTVITFLISGLWHGAHLKYLAWGALHAVYMIPLLLQKKDPAVKTGTEKKVPVVSAIPRIVFTFLLVLLAWIFFRANSITDALTIYREIFSDSLFSLPEILPRKIMILLLFFILMEWLGRGSPYAIAQTGSGRPWYFRWIFYYLIILLIFLEGGREQPFIYFQF